MLILGFLFLSVGMQAQMNILLVNDNNYQQSEINIIKTTLTTLGYSYTFYDCIDESSSPTLEFMEVYSLVIWYTGKDEAGLYLWNTNNTENQDIKDYIDGGGMFWLQGRRFIYDVYGLAPDTFVAGDFVYDYLGIEEYFAESYVDDGNAGVPQLDAVPGNGIFTLDPIVGEYSTIWKADAMLPAPGADSIYRMGPTGYDFDDYYTCIYNEKGDGKVLSFAFETSEFDTQQMMDTVFNQGLQYFEQFASTIVYVTDITVTAEGGATTIDVNQGTLQMYADVQPPNATIPTVLWSVVDSSTTASIDQNGLLQATGTTFGNGTVWAKAEAIDGSGVADSLEITISNQGSDFEVLLVNDCNRVSGGGLTRYQEIDTTLSNLQIAHDIYHTGSTGTYPDLARLSYYDFVIWYTGNDGVSLKLWDLSIPSDYKFNEALISYLNSGQGALWLQGLDFFYDIYGSAPDAFTPGQFIYDYMGIANYAAQSFADDGSVGLQQLDKEAGNPEPICSFTPIEWTISETGGYLKFADGFEMAPSAQGVYRMGPSGYQLEQYLPGIYNKYGNSKIFTFGKPPSVIVLKR